MRNILLLILVATIPLMSVAQKRSKKGSNAKMDKMVKKTPSEYEYMIIEGVQSTSSDEEKMMGYVANEDLRYVLDYNDSVVMNITKICKLSTLMKFL